MKIVVTSLITLAVLLPGMALGQSISSAGQRQAAPMQVQPIPPLDFYTLKCSDFAPSGCTLYVTTVLLDGTVYTHVRPNVQSGEEVNLNHINVVESQTALVQN